MHVLGNAVAVLATIILSVSPPLQCVAQTLSEKSIFSIIHDEKALSQGIKSEENRDFVINGGNIIDLKSSEEVCDRENDAEISLLSVNYNQIKSFGPHVHNSDCVQAQNETPICARVVTSISPYYPELTINKNESMITIAIATYLDGHTGIVNCTNNYNPYIGGSQTVNLTYSGLVGNAKTTGTRTCTVNVTQLQPSGAHLHTAGCYAGHRHSSRCIPAGYMDGQVYATNIGSYIVNGFWTNIDCAKCNNIIATLGSSFTGQQIHYTVTYRHYDSNGAVISTTKSNVAYYYDGSNPNVYPFDCLVNTYSRAVYERIAQYKMSNSSRTYNFNFKDALPEYGWYTYPDREYYSFPYIGCPYCGVYGANYSCGEAQDENPICNQVVTSIHMANSDQIITGNDALRTTTTATFLDGHTGIISLTSNFNPNLEGTQTVTLTYKGLYGNARTTEEKKDNITVIFDKTSPTVSANILSSINSLRINASATDNVSLASNGYKYTIGSVTGAYNKTVNDTDWLSSASYMVSNLIPNTAYSYKVQVRDSVGNTSLPYEGTTYTKIDTPLVTVNSLEDNRIEILVEDSNPADTLYSVKVGNQFFDQNGMLSQARSEYTLVQDPLTNKKQLIIAGLGNNAKYDITVSAKEIVTGNLCNSNTLSIITAPFAPEDLSESDVTTSSIKLSWDNAPGAVSYELQRETLSSDGIVKSSGIIKDIVSASYNDTNLTANQTYRYSIRSKNEYSQYSSWSFLPLTVKTEPLPPEQVTGLRADIERSKLNISWESIAGAVGYELEVSYDGETKCYKVSKQDYSIDTEKYDCQCRIKVRAYNKCSESNPSGTNQWSNVGEWSKEYSCYTSAEKPSISEILVTHNSATVTWDAKGNPESVGYVLGIYSMNTLVKEVTLTDSDLEDDKLTCTITGLQPSIDYLFKIKALNSVKQETSWSDGVTCMTLIDIPAVPDGLRASSTTARINIAWNPVNFAQNYDIERNEVIIATGLASSTYADKDVTVGAEYSYRIRAVNTTGTSEWSTELKAKLGAMPAAPQVTVTTGSSISVSLAWNPIVGSTSYDIEVDGEKYTTTEGTSFDHTGLTPGEEHTYRIRSRSSIGYSAWSEPVNAMTTPVTPAIPSGITTVPNGNQIYIKWKSVPNAASYDVEIDKSVYYQIQASEYLHSVTKVETGAAIHTVRVRSVNKGYVSDWSEVSEATITGESNPQSITIPAAPVIASCVTGASIINISWDETEGATNYQVEADGKVVYTGTNTTYVHRGLKEKSKHQYRVRAGNIGGYSEWSTPYEVTTASLNNTTPRNLTYYREDSTTTAIVWDGSSNVSKYRIEVNGVLLEEELTSTKTSIPTIPDKQYRVRIAALVQEGDKTVYDWSDEMSFNAPSNLPGIPKISDISATSDKITLSWDEVTGANGYDIDIEGQIIDVKNKQTYTITNLKPSTSYPVKVRAYNSAGKGSWSEISTIMTNEGVQGVPVNITVKAAVTTSVATGCAIRISWTSVVGAASYEVEDMSGTIHSSNTNEIMIDNLQPGIRYDFRVRAINTTEKGPWSSKISFIPTVTVPENIKLKVENETVRLSWDGVGGAKTYEIEIDGVVYATTTNPAKDFAYQVFYSQRAVRVRACNDTIKSEWSEELLYNQPLPKVISVNDNEEFSVILPVKKVNLNKYKFTLTFDSEELELLDAYESTPKAEKGTTYLKDIGVYMIQSKSGTITSITFVVDDDKKTNWTGIVSSMRFRSKKTGNATLKYGVTLK